MRHRFRRQRQRDTRGEDKFQPARDPDVLREEYGAYDSLPPGVRQLYANADDHMSCVAMADVISSGAVTPDQASAFAASMVKRA